MNIFKKLDKYEQTHPIIINLWKEYIKKQESNLKKTKTACMTMLENIEEFEDFDFKMILCLFILKKHLKISDNLY
tara:strand:- start:1437 stop:1661 length:225 start_codon:yes stop_codon:yes gene_type:complete